MRRVFLPLIAALLPIPAASAQQPETIHVLSAATAFVRDSVARTHGRVVIDAESFKRGPGVSSADADAVARSVGASRGRFEDVVKCDTKQPGVRQRCSAEGGGTVVTYGRPTIGDGVATVLVVYSTVNERDRLEAQEVLIRLRRETEGRWRVTSWEVGGGT